MNESIQKAKALFAPVPHVQLGSFPTPFYKLENMSKALGVNLYIKRDDFTGMNLFGGNKIRKLENSCWEMPFAKGCKAVRHLRRDTVEPRDGNRLRLPPLRIGADFVSDCGCKA